MGRHRKRMLVQLRTWTRRTRAYGGVRRMSRPATPKPRFARVAAPLPVLDTDDVKTPWGASVALWCTLGALVFSVLVWACPG